MVATLSSLPPNYHLLHIHHLMLTIMAPRRVCGRLPKVSSNLEFTQGACVGIDKVEKKAFCFGAGEIILE